MTAKPKDLPTIKVKLPRDGIIEVKEGEPFELNFDLSSEDCEASFFKGDQRIKDDMGRAVVTRMGRRFRFFIPETNESDSGCYTMEVESAAGVVTKNFQINVSGKNSSCNVYCFLFKECMLLYYFLGVNLSWRSAPMHVRTSLLHCHCIYITIILCS